MDTKNDSKASQPALLIKPDSITVVTDNGVVRQVRKEQSNFFALREAISSKDWDQVILLSNPVAKLEEVLSSSLGGRVSMTEGQILVDDAPVKNYLTEKILSFARDSLPFEHLLEFLDNLQSNPSMRAREELYSFLETEDLPITADGHFLAYKAVRSDWKDKHSGTIDNSIGNVVEMPRDKVDDNQAVGCSKGLHAGSLAYVAGFGHGADVFLLVKINPADVVCIPREDCRKLRCCKYVVTGVMPGEMLYHLYDTDGVTPIGNLKNHYHLDENDSDWDNWDDDTDDYEYGLDDDFGDGDEEYDEDDTED